MAVINCVRVAYVNTNKRSGILTKVMYAFIQENRNEHSRKSNGVVMSVQWCDVIRYS